MKKLNYIILGLALITTMSCERTVVEPEGPPLKELFGEFGIVNSLSQSSDSVDFEAGELVNFKADLKAYSNWTLTITGDASGATKVYTNNVSDINIWWDGSSTGLPAFRKESYTATLTFANQDTSFVVTGFVESAKKYDAVVVEDFENGFNFGWGGFVQTGANMDFTVKSSGAPQGTRYYNMAGTVPWDYFIGSIAVSAQLANETDYFPLTPASKYVYLNIMVQGFGSTYDGGFMLCNIFEDDNGNGEHDAEGDDVYTYEFDLDFDGWKVVSIPYDQFNLSANSTGNNIRNSNNITELEIGLLIPPENGHVATAIDFVSFTQGAPLKP